MAFGFPNPFGGSSDKDKDQSTSTDNLPQEAPSTSSIFTGSGGSGGSTNANGTPSSFSHGITGTSNASSNDIKSRVQTAIATQSNVANAKALISKINENCFDHCVPAPGSSLSSREQSCLSACMEKYIDGWNVVSRTYVARLQREGVASSSPQQQQQGGLF